MFRPSGRVDPSEGRTSQPGQRRVDFARPVHTFSMMRRFVPTLIGTLGGLGFGYVWWLAWGCQVGAPGSAPWGPLIFSTFVGAGLGHFLGKDYVHPSP